MSPKSGGHVAALDGLRGLAIVMVLFVHFIGDATPITFAERAAVKLANYGVWGVDLFFVLSGFLITGILDDAKGGPRYFRNFYVRRTLRIFPLYYGTLALLFIVLPVLPLAYPHGLAESSRHQGWLWAYGTNFYCAIHRDWALPYVSHFWSLAVEEHFYLVWPLVVLAFSRRALVRICVVGSVLALGLRCVLSSAGAGDVAITTLTPCRLDALLIGGFLALEVRSVGLARVAQFAKPVFWSSATIIALASTWNAATNGALRDIVLPVRGTLIAALFGALLLMTVTATRDTVLGRVFQSRVMCFFGKYSYGLYVFHGIIAAALVERATESALTARIGSHAGAIALQAIGGVAVSLAIAVASYELFEKRILRLKDRFAPSVALVTGIAIVALTVSCVPSRETHGRGTAAGVPCVMAQTPSAPMTGPRLVLTANPIVSRTKRVEGWSPAQFSKPERAVDGDYGTWWQVDRPTAAKPAWLAIEIGAGPKRLLLAWTSNGSPDYEETDYGSPGAYHIDVSSDSTNGDNGTWKTVVTVADVKTHGQSHVFDFAGDRWVKLVITGVPAASPNGVQITEVDVHDASAGTNDTWFFMGDSITAAAFDRKHQPSFATCVHDRHAGFFPMMLNGGVGGAASKDGAGRVNDWIAQNPDAHFWAIGYGSNDSAGDASDTTSFRANMSTIVERLRAAGRVPILATIPYANDGHHINVPSFNRVIEDVRAANALPAGPDLYAWFLAHPDELRDGLHPNERGVVSMNRLWADAVDPLYPR